MNTLIQNDLKYIWHPYTQMKDCREFPPILIERAKGIKLYDMDGKFYYDTISSWWCNVHGHNHPKIKSAIKRQLDKLEHVLFAGFTHEPAIELAERLVAIAPKPIKKVFFSDNGSTAVETALKMSFQYWRNIGNKKKKTFVCLDHGYHGDTIGTMSVSGVGLFNRVFSPLFFESYKVPSPYCYRCPVNKERKDCKIDCAGAIEDLLKKKSSEICGIILEPLVMAAGGMIIYPKEYLSRVGELAKKYNIHLIADEVATGFGRTGKMFACEYANVRPDFMCLSKGLTAGYLPMGITLTTDDVYSAFYDDFEKFKTLYHGHTYTANPLSCAAANASLDVFKEEDTLVNAKRIEALVIKGIEGFSEYPFVGDVRHIGMIGALELVKNKKTKEQFDIKRRIGLEIYKEGLKNNIVLRPLGNIIYLFLPLCVKEADLKCIFEKMHKMFRK